MNDSSHGADQARCALCHRVVPVSAHHLIPRAVHGKKRFRERFGIDEMRSRKIPLCRHCHRAVHELIPHERDLAESYNTLASLRAHPGIARHVEWAKKQKR
jgi:hypothetical protein